MKSLGIDLGSNSLGWAIVEDKEIRKTGVILFDEGILRDKGNDSIKTPAGERCRFRAARRLKYRKRLRKYHLLKILIENDMCPLSIEGLKNWIKKKEYPIHEPEFQAWLSCEEDSNPYYARAMAAKQEVSKYEMGRAFFHIAQRRGFLSSRKGADVELSDEKKKKKDDGKVGNSINAISERLNNRTLGELFYDELKSGKKVRSQHTGRKEHYFKEFEKICQTQSLSENLILSLKKAIFLQRPLRSQRHLVGGCDLEPKRVRCLISHPLFEEYRMLSLVNNIRIGKEKRVLNEEERSKVIARFYLKRAYFKFEDLKKTLYPNSKSEKNNLTPIFNYRDDRSISGCQVSGQLKSIFGDDWQNFSKVYQRANGSMSLLTIQSVFDALYFFDDNEKLKMYGMTRLGLSEDKAEEFVKIKLTDGYAAYSLYAIKKIIVFLREGYELSTAKLLAKIPDIVGAERWNLEGQKIKNDIMEVISRWRAMRSIDGSNHFSISLRSSLENYFSIDLKLSPEQVKQIYWHEEKNPYGDKRNDTILPAVNLGMIKNPLVQRSMTILRRFINYLRKHQQIDRDTRIHIELARSVNDRNTRLAYEVYQKQQENARKNAAERLEEEKYSVTDEMIERYLLWEEQDRKCLYTGSKISISDLREFDIEHTIPRSRSGNNSRANRTLCNRHFNSKVKNKKIPSECGTYDEIMIRLTPWIKKVEHLREKYETERSAVKKVPHDNKELRSKKRVQMLVTKMELDYWNEKVTYFKMQPGELKEGFGFKKRQLVDTGVMTRHALQLVRSVYPETYGVNGRAVEWARKSWGLQTLFEKKDRTDHIHHAIDAIVIAYLDTFRFQTICEYYREDGEAASHMHIIASQKEKLLPFEDFSTRVYEKTDDILVRNITRHVETKQTWRKAVTLTSPVKKDGRRVVPAAGSTVRGQLHKESFYGCIQLPPNHPDQTKNEKKFVITVMVESLKLKECEKIVDLAVREKMISQASAHIDKGIPVKNVFKQPYWMNESKGIPIKRVRVFADDVKNPNQIKMHSHLSMHDYKNPYYVKSGVGSNFMMAFYKKVGKKGKIDYNSVVINLLEWIQKDYIPPAERTEYGDFIGVVMSGTLALAYEKTPTELYAMSHSQLSKRLYRIISFEGSDKPVWLRLHREARTSDMLDKLKLKGVSKINYEKGTPELRISTKNYREHLLYEGIDFTMTLDGDIEFIKKE